MIVQTCRALVAASMAIAFGAVGPVHAQTISGFKVGQDLKAAAKNHPRPSTQDALGAFAVFKWAQPNGNAVSVTASPQTGAIVFIESDWGGDAKNAVTEVPGLTFGVSTLADIRAKFQSNGFGFKTNVMQVIGSDLVSLNCYQIKGDDDLVAVFVTALPISSVPVVAGKPQPDSGQGRLNAVILAKLAYLKDLWGADRLFDPAYKPVDWK